MHVTEVIYKRPTDVKNNVRRTLFIIREVRHAQYHPGRACGLCDADKHTGRKCQMAKTKKQHLNHCARGQLEKIVVRIFKKKLKKNWNVVIYHNPVYFRWESRWKIKLGQFLAETWSNVPRLQLKLVFTLYLFFEVPRQGGIFWLSTKYLKDLRSK